MKIGSKQNGEAHLHTDSEYALEKMSVHRCDTYRLLTAGASTYRYDANGNTIERHQAGERWNLAYDSRNRLALVQRQGQDIAAYTYNALGERIGKDTLYPTPLSQRYVYDEQHHLLGEYGDSTRDYVWVDDLPVAVVDTQNGIATVNYIHADGLNTPRAVTDAAKKVLWAWPYSGNPYGEQPPVSNGFALNLRFPGQYYDAETGTHYNVNRDYDPAIGRYIRPDPLGQEAGMSLYGYVGGNPLSYIDLLGLDFFGKCLAQRYLNKYGDDAWIYARQERNKSSDPVYPGTPQEALRNAEHYLYTYQEAKNGQWTATAGLLSVGYAGYKITRNTIQRSSSPYREDYPSIDEVKSGIEGSIDAKNGGGDPSICGCDAP